MEHTKRQRSSGACCRDEGKMVRCAVTALEQMKDMFGAALGSKADDPENSTRQQSKQESSCHRCQMSDNCRITGCPFRVTGPPPDALRLLYREDKRQQRLRLLKDEEKQEPRLFEEEERQKLRKRPVVKNGRSDRTAMHLLPGEVGLRGDRATFHLGSNGGEQQQPTAGPGYKNGLPTTGAVYFNMPENDAEQQQQRPRRKHVMQILPATPASLGPRVGPVTGLPVSDNEHVFVFRVAKKHDEPDEKARLQIEVRIPKAVKPAAAAACPEVGTQCSKADVAPKPAPPKKSKDKKRGRSAKGKKKGKQGKKGKK